jgi:hypothetical protein
VGAAIWASVIGVVIVALAVGIPYWLTHRHMRPQHDPREAQAYQQATGRSAEQIAAGEQGQTLRVGRGAGRRWHAAHAGVDPETGEPEPKTGKPGWPEGTG